MEIITVAVCAVLGAASYVCYVRPALDERATKRDMAK